MTKSEFVVIRKIVKRAAALFRLYGADYPAMTCEMDLTACHANCNRLDLDRLMLADDFNFLHDVAGIRRHINRETGELMDCFVPRYSRRGS